LLYGHSELADGIDGLSEERHLVELCPGSDAFRDEPRAVEMFKKFPFGLLSGFQEEFVERRDFGVLAVVPALNGE
jgi:hypothetical protein